LPASTTPHQAVERWRFALCLAIFTVLTLYGSLYPWAPRDSKLGPSAWSILTSAYWFRLGLGMRADVVLNVLFYVPFGLFGVWSLPARWPAWARVLVAIAGGALLSLAVELAQFYVSSRVTSPADLAMNALGTSIGAILAAGVASRVNWPALVMPLLLAACGMASVALNLWIGNQWELAKLVLVSGLLVWSMRTASRLPFLLFLAMIGFEQLRPFRFAPAPIPFDWRPLVASITGSGLARAATFSFKLFFYGSTLVAAIRAGLPAGRTALMLGGFLLGLEYVQRWLPPRTPEVTDALIPLLWMLLVPNRSANVSASAVGAGARPRAIV
jgi:hypothetical protein